MTEVNENKEIREWLGLAPADIPVWVSAGLLVWMWFAGSAMLAVILGAAAVVLSLAACFIGTRAEEDLSHFTNLAKKYGYPAWVVMVIAAAVVIYYMRWLAS